MKSTLIWLSTAILLISGGDFCLAQKPFEGKIVYAVNYLNIPEGQIGKKRALPSSLIAFVQGQNVRMQQYTSLAGEWTIIQPANVDSTYHCFYLLDERVMISRPVKKRAARFRVVEQEDSKAWSNFEMTAFRLQKADGEYLTAWCATRYMNPFQVDMPELNFLPLIFELERGDLRMRLTATTVEQMPLDASYFEVPDNVELISEEVLTRLLN